MILVWLRSALTVLAEVLTVLASLTVLYVFFAKRGAVASALRLLLGYANQLTLTELFSKLDRLNDLNADEESQSKMVKNILGDIVGRIRGNKMLRRECAEVLDRAVRLVNRARPIEEPRKRALVSEIRETLRSISVQNIDGLTGGEHD